MVDKVTCDSWVTGTEAFGLPDRHVTTWSGGKLIDYLKDAPHPRDFGALGYPRSAVTYDNSQTLVNSTDGFKKLEQSIYNQQVDLLGLCYVVDAFPTGNRYYNGYFCVNGLIHTQELLTVLDPKWIRGCGEGFIYDEILIDERLTANFIQSMHYDQFTNTYWALSTFRDTTTNVESSVIFNIDCHGRQTGKTILQSQRMETIGHQGLGVQHLDGGDLRLWVGCPISHAKSGTHIIRTKPPANGGVIDPASMEYFQVYNLAEGNISKTYHCSPSVSPSENLLCVIQTDYAQHQSVIKVFETKNFTDSSVDYSEKYLHKFLLATYHEGAGSPPQSVVTDGKYVYVLMGTHTIHVYTMGGQLVDLIPHTTGKERSKGFTSATGVEVKVEYYEPESLLFVPTNDGYTLAVSTVMGYVGGWGVTDKRYNYVYTSIPRTTQRSIGIGSTAPALMSSSPIDVTAPYVKGFTIGLQGNTGDKGDIFKAATFRNRQFVLYNADMTASEGRDTGLVFSATTAAGRNIGTMSTSTAGTSQGGTISLYGTSDGSLAKGGVVLFTGILDGVGHSIGIYPSGTIEPTVGMTFGTAARRLERMYAKAVYFTGTVFSTVGTGSPEGVLAGGIGSQYSDTTNGKFYIKRSGTGNTGWVEL